jgi:hypothetical protein
MFVRTGEKMFSMLSEVREGSQDWPQAPLLMLMADQLLCGYCMGNAIAVLLSRCPWYLWCDRHTVALQNTESLGAIICGRIWMASY